MLQEDSYRWEMCQKENLKIIYIYMYGTPRHVIKSFNFVLSTGHRGKKNCELWDTKTRFGVSTISLQAIRKVMLKEINYFEHIILHHALWCWLCFKLPLFRGDLERQWWQVLVNRKSLAIRDTCLPGNIHLHVLNNDFKFVIVLKLWINIMI